MEIPSVSGNCCTTCGSKLVIGDFAYNQELCQSCFSRKVLRIVDTLQDYEQKKLVKWMATVILSRHGIDPSIHRQS